MNIAADILLMLASFSLRMHFIHKALIYGEAGTKLFPEDTRLREIYAYALFLDGKLERASEVIRNTQQKSKNIAFVNSRVILQTSRDPGERIAAMRLYLRAEG